ncbi:hypothetical protein [Acidiphilium sp. MT5]
MDGAGDQGFGAVAVAELGGEQPLGLSGVAVATVGGGEDFFDDDMAVQPVDRARFGGDQADDDAVEGDEIEGAGGVAGGEFIGAGGVEFGGECGVIGGEGVIPVGDLLGGLGDILLGRFGGVRAGFQGDMCCPE